jgi:hypothetical protein
MTYMDHQRMYHMPIPCSVCGRMINGHWNALERIVDGTRQFAHLPVARGFSCNQPDWKMVAMRKEKE